MSDAPGTSSRTSTPSRAAARSACTYGVVPAKYASVSHNVLRAIAATSWSTRNMPAVFGTVATTRSGDAAGMMRCRRRIGSSDGSGSPAAAQASANALSMSATAGPRTSSPVSRQGSSPRAGSPTHALADAQARHERDGAVDGDHLAVIAAQPAERTIEPGRVVAADLDAGRRAADSRSGATSCRSRPSSRRAAAPSTPSAALRISASANSRPDRPRG